MENTDKQKKIKKYVDMINKQAAKDSLTKKKFALLIDPIPDCIFINRNNRNG